MKNLNKRNAPPKAATLQNFWVHLNDAGLKARDADNKPVQINAYTKKSATHQARQRFGAGSFVTPV